jgi:type IV secretory pathway protease TraF
MAYKLVQPYNGSAWVEGDGSTTAVPVNLNTAPFNVPASHTIATLSITDPLGIYTITNSVSNVASGLVTVTCTPAVTAGAIVQFNYTGFFI